MFEFIQTTKELRLFINQLGDIDWVALDTEFLRERTYYAKLCLIQIEANGFRACIDPLSISDFSPLIEVLNNPSITKVFHAAHQDLEIFLQLTGKVPSPIFDTQVAAAVLGYGDQMGYARLIEQMLGISLSKTQSRTDWARRPLNKAQLEYAIDDVRYLAKIYPTMLDSLKQKKRLDWLKKDFTNAVNPDTYAIKAKERWKKVRGNQILKRSQLAILAELAAWREVQAEKNNRPRKWIISDDILLELARQKPLTTHEILEIRGLQSDKMKRFHNILLKLIKKGTQSLEQDWPQVTRSKKPNIQQMVLIDLLMLVLQIQAKKHGISPSVIATKKQVANMILSGSHVLSNDWRGDLVNKEFYNVISGEDAILVQNNQVTIKNLARLASINKDSDNS